MVGKAKKFYKFRRGVRVAEGARLESVYTFTRIEGSNPSLSAKNCPTDFSAGLFFA